MARSIHAAARPSYHALATAKIDRVLDRDEGWRIVAHRGAEELFESTGAKDERFC